MKKSLYYLSGLLLLITCTPTVYGRNKVAIKNKTPFSIQFTAIPGEQTTCKLGCRGTIGEVKPNTETLFPDNYGWWVTDNNVHKPVEKITFDPYAFIPLYKPSSASLIEFKFNPPFSGDDVTLTIDTKFRFVKEEPKGVASPRGGLVKNKTPFPITFTFFEARGTGKNSITVQPNQEALVDMSGPKKEVQAKIAIQGTPTELSPIKLADWERSGIFVVEFDPITVQKTP